MENGIPQLRENADSPKSGKRMTIEQLVSTDTSNLENPSELTFAETVMAERLTSIQFLPAHLPPPYKRKLTGADGRRVDTLGNPVRRHNSTATPTKGNYVNNDRKGNGPHKPQPNF